MEKKKVAVAMSGGVDSSVTAALLLEQGYEVIGITLRLSEESRSVEAAEGITGTAVADAAAVCRVLGIEHHVFDLREVFAEKVIGYFLAEYAAGRTPNPCVACNKNVKFGALLEQAQALGADYLATGHYARITRDEDGTAHLLKGLDETKDQSYVLYQLSQDALQQVLLPLGGMCKTDVRKLAENKYHLPVAQKAESQEICFIPDDDHVGFMRQRMPEAFVPGEIVDRTGKVVGKHEGLPLYTIGQRKGLGIYEPEPRYVVCLDCAKNQVVVGEGSEVFAQGLTASQLAWTQGTAPDSAEGLTAKIRYGRRVGEVTALEIRDGLLHLTFAAAQRAITPGQSVVIYRGEEVLGGGIIESTL